MWHSRCNALGMEQLSTLHGFKRHARPILAGVVLGVALIWAQNALANPLANTAQAPETMDESMTREARTCALATTKQERRHAIPQGLLKAISHAESGRWDPQNKAILAWPWTVTTGGKGYFLPNRADAVAFVQSLQADGVENIDVGCMQINLKYHPDAFASIDEAFNPHTNAAYAADVLRERFANSGSWLQAAGDYHSTTAGLNKRYRAKIVKLWNAAKASPTTPTTAHTAPAQPAAPKVATAATATTTPPVNAPAAPLAKVASAYSPPDAGLSKRFNDAFRARRNGGGVSGDGQAIVNRLNALKPGQPLNRAPGQIAANSFAQKRQAQVMAWRRDQGTATLVAQVTPLASPVDSPSPHP